LLCSGCKAAFCACCSACLLIAALRCCCSRLPVSFSILAVPCTPVAERCMRIMLSLSCCNVHLQGLLLVAAANATSYCPAGDGPDSCDPDNSCPQCTYVCICTPLTKPADSSFCADKCGPYTLPDGCQGTFKVECPCTGGSSPDAPDAPTPTPTWTMYDNAPTSAPTAAPVGVELPGGGGEFPVVPPPSGGDSGRPSGKQQALHMIVRTLQLRL
jgi:hypothetical protein